MGESYTWDCITFPNSTFSLNHDLILIHYKYYIVINCGYYMGVVTAIHYCGQLILAAYIQGTYSVFYKPVIPNMSTMLLVLDSAKV